MAMFVHRIAVILVFLMVLMSTETSSQSLNKPATLSTSFGSQKRNLNIVRGHRAAKESREQNPALAHPNLRSSKNLHRVHQRKPVSNIGKEVVKEKDGDNVKKTAGSIDGVQSNQEKDDEDSHGDTGSSSTRLRSGEEKQRQKLISQIAKLLKRHRDLVSTRESLRSLDNKASDSYHEVLMRRNVLSQAWENAHRARLRVERDLEFFQTHSGLQDETLRQLESQAKNAASFMEKLKRKYTHLLEDKAQLAEDFREHGLEHWVENSVKGTVNPIVLDAIMQGTGYVVEPMLDGIGKLATMNNEVASVVSRGLNSQTSIASYPFYSGFVSYTVLLCPLVIVVSLLTRIKKGVSRLSRSSWIILGTFYYFMVTGGCLVATMVGSVDVLQTFRVQNIHVFNSVLVIHGFAYFIYVLLHLYNLIQVHNHRTASHFLIVTTIGLHFLFRSQRQSSRLGGLEVEIWTYSVYNAVLSFVLYETVFKRECSSRMPEKGKVMEASQDTAHGFGPSSTSSNISPKHVSGD